MVKLLVFLEKRQYDNLHWAKGVAPITPPFLFQKRLTENFQEELSNEVLATPA
jgi:hypothetical protein